ncbi:hypothetical protein [Fibrobacter sp.]|uniref:hypothetical protein n=1 Tax=Fibrobacter sp. TaxID=35828 RepID=UPI0038683C7F
MSNVQKYDSYTCTVKEFKDLDPKNIKIIDFIDRRNVYATVRDEEGNICLIRYELKTALTAKDMLLLPAWRPLLAVFSVRAEALNEQQKEEAFRLFYSAIERNRSIFFKKKGGLLPCVFALSDAAAVYAERACREAVQTLRG